jgi:hypothetical protein
VDSLLGFYASSLQPAYDGGPMKSASWPETSVIDRPEFGSAGIYWRETHHSEDPSEAGSKSPEFRFTLSNPAAKAEWEAKAPI